MKVGTRVECTCHKGQHKGKIVRLIGDRFGVAWEDSNKGFMTNGLPQFPDHFIKGRGNHRGDLVTVGADRIRIAR